MQVNASRLLVATSVLFWGWMTGMWVFALPMAGLVVASVFVRRRLAFTPREFARLWDVTLVLLVGAAIYNRQTLSVSAALISFLQWLPILLFAFTIALFFSREQSVPRSTFVFWWRSNSTRIAAGRNLDPMYPYFAVCLLAASAGGRDRMFYPVAAVLIAAAIAINRGSRGRAAPVALLLVVVAAAGHMLHTRWRDFQAELESRTIQWISGFFPKQFEDQETHTSLGDIGRLKSSGRMVMVVHGEGQGNVPGLYRQLAFDLYRRGIWLSTRRQYAPVAEAAAGTWELAPAPASNSVVLRAAVPDGRIFLPMPLGCTRARRLSATRLERNRFGNVRVWDCADPMECTLDFNVDTTIEPPPGKTDLEVQLMDEPVISAVARELRLESMSGHEVLDTVDQFFSSGFRYAPYVPEAVSAPSSMASPVATFLTSTRAGHCEYFATAAVLLLRKANIPARYAMGYAAIEAGAGRREFRIRERHAHSWVLAWVDGRWRDFDPTPREWSRHELQASSMARPLKDRWADLRFWLAGWRPLPGLNGGKGLLLLCPLAICLVWLLLRRRGAIRARNPRVSLAEAYAWPGLDSEFFLVEQALKANGSARRAGETASAWLLRMAPQRSAIIQLEAALKLHYKYRFDPLGLDAEERAVLASAVRAWLAENRERN